MNGRLDHPVTESGVGEKRKIFKNRSCTSEAVLSVVRDTETLFLVRLEETGRAGSTLIEPNEDQDIRSWRSVISARIDREHHPENRGCPAFSSVGPRTHAEVLDQSHEHRSWRKRP